MSKDAVGLLILIKNKTAAGRFVSRKDAKHIAKAQRGAEILRVLEKIFAPLRETFLA
jgi:hypothetical protein